MAGTIYWDSWLEKKTCKLHIWEFTDPTTLKHKIETWRPHVYRRAHVETLQPKKRTEILYEMKDGNRVVKEEKFSIYPTNLRSLEGHQVERVEFKNWFTMVQELKDLNNDEKLNIYENNFVPVEMGRIADLYRDNIEWKVKPNILYFDIECPAEKGFPLVEEAAWPVTSFVVCRSWEDHKLVAYGLKPLSDGYELPENCIYRYCKDEQELLLGFIKEVYNAHVIAGWNSNQFDMPYLHKRMQVVANKYPGHKSAKWLKRGFSNTSATGECNVYSSFDSVLKRKKHHMKIPGKALVDLLDIYKKYTRESLSSYKLDFVGKHEFGEGKLEFYDEDGQGKLSLWELQQQNWDAFLSYNVRDVTLLRDIDNKRALTALIFEISQIARIPVDRTVYMSAIVDGALLQFLRKQNLVAPGNFMTENAIPYTGGFVKQPISIWGKRFYKHTACIDVTSEYPSATVKMNVSPETFIGRIKLPVFEDRRVSGLTRDVLDLLPTSGQLEINNMLGTTMKDAAELRQEVESGKVCISIDGCMFSNVKQGVFSAFTEYGFIHRKALKREFQKHRDHYDHHKDEKSKELKFLYHTSQQGWKLILNSAYGQTGSRYSRLYNPYIAQAITATGVGIVYNGERYVNEFFTFRYKEFADELIEIAQKYNPNITSVPFWDDTVKDRVATMDTDSCISSLDDVVATVFPNAPWPLKEDEVTIEFIDEVMNVLVRGLNVHLNTEFAPKRLRATSTFNLGFEHEVDKASYGAIFLAKKKYILHRFNDELKVTGFELKKVNISESVRTELEKFVRFTLDEGPRMTAQDMICRLLHSAKHVHDRIVSGTPEEVARRLSYSVGVSNLEKYRAPEGEPEIFIKGTPIHVKGALIHNQLIKELKSGISEIYSGDRINLLKCVPTKDNPKWNALGFNGVLPPEFLEKFTPNAPGIITVDYIQKCTKLVEAFGWDGELKFILKKLNRKFGAGKWMQCPSDVDPALIAEGIEEFKNSPPTKKRLILKSKK